MRTKRLFAYGPYVLRFTFYALRIDLRITKGVVATMGTDQQHYQSTFMSSPQVFLTSESVTEGHPDKLCDQISDAVLDAILERDPDARVACETATTTGIIMVMGEITTTAW